jgi:DNA replication protein DnaC
METPSFDELMKKAAKDAAEGKAPAPPDPEPPKDIELTEVPTRYRKAKLSDTPIPLKDEESVFFFSAKPGTGKTHLAWAYYINERLKNAKSKPLFSTFGELQLRLRQSMDTNLETENAIVKEFSNRKMVILDDLGGLRPTAASDYSLAMIFEILNNRYSWQRQTIITSNKNLDEIEKSFDARIASRIIGWCKIIEIDGEDRRIEQGA